jgi:hypothetical protein
LINLRKSLELRGGVLVCYPDFQKAVNFCLYTDSSDHQLGALIMQDRKPIVFYSQKLNTAQKQNLQGIQEYPVRLPFTHHRLYIPKE